MTMEDLECFVRLIGNHPIARIQTEYIDRTPHMESLIERTIDFDALEKINQHALSVQNNAQVNEEVKKLRAFDEAAHCIGEDENAEDEFKPCKKATGIKAVEESFEYEETLF